MTIPHLASNGNTLADLQTGNGLKDTLQITKEVNHLQLNWLMNWSHWSVPFEAVTGTLIKMPMVKALPVCSLDLWSGPKGNELVHFMGGELSRDHANNIYVADTPKSIWSLLIQMEARRGVGSWADYIAYCKIRASENRHLLAIVDYADGLVTVDPGTTACHGDLTLENILYDGKRLYVIDPNPVEPWTHVALDYGKILFSLMGYHEYFGSYWLREKWNNLRDYLLSEPLYVACMLTHCVRLAGYYPAEDVVGFSRAVFERIKT